MKILLKLLKQTANIIVLSFLMVNIMNTASNSLIAAEFQKGMCYATWDKDSFGTPQSEEALKMLKNMGVEYVQINVTEYQNTYNSTTIKATDLTPSVESIKTAIKVAHKLGLKVMLKPHIDLIDNVDGTYWRADIGFNTEEDWQTWFKQYEQFITKYARIAAETNTEIFSVGTELSFTTQRSDHWKNIIASVKKVYNGKLIYAANWDEYRQIQFWENLDYVGIDAYFPLTYKENPTIEDIKQGWEKWRIEIETFATEVSKPIIFTELGYASTLTAASEPWANAKTGNADTILQANCYKAFFETIWKCPWLKGVYWWHFSPTVNGGGINNRQFTPLNKPSADILKQHYTDRTSSINAGLTKEIDSKFDMLNKKTSFNKDGLYSIKEKKDKDRKINN
ncbi:conserved hypothetical protein, secreted [Candidatus Omnitrophus magneticus]|uniref:Uncharacterized protein n=1 Tax=Candidatus Omnitrophus magneticus TaxID=1609969 RepID=A0A0F0CSG0_9BACT|nr:conserved hypothetical protein, secreted [Candidatus Omnitrophus magneticus]